MEMKRFITVLLIAINVLVVFVLANRKSTVPVESFLPEPERGSSKQVERIGRFISDVAKQDLKELENALTEEMLTNIVHARMTSSTLSGQNYLAGVWGDRRVAKIFAEYQSLNHDQARQRSLELFERYLKEHSQRLDRATNEFDKNGWFDRQPDDPESSNHACMCSIFFLTQFGSLQDVHSALSRWREINDTANAKIVAEFGGTRISGTVAEDPPSIKVFLVNACLLALQKHLSRSKFDTVAQERIQIRLENLVTVDFVAWDAHTNPQDFTHRHQMVPYDDSKVLATYHYIPHAERLRASTEDVRDQFVQRAMETISDTMN